MMNSKNDHTFFANRDCKYYPCHKNADPESFNCLFCYCPLYMLGDQCGGNFCYTEKGIKNCTNCVIPHAEGGYAHVVKSFSKITAMMKKPDNISNE